MRVKRDVGTIDPDFADQAICEQAQRRRDTSHRRKFESAVAFALNKPRMPTAKITVDTSTSVSDMPSERERAACL